MLYIYSIIEGETLKIYLDVSIKKGGSPLFW